jgi:glycosyltransferase involved in cell wall biosynthesis
MRVSGRPIRVLQVIGALYFGGAEKVVASLALGVDRSRFEMAVCLTRGFGPLSEAVRAGGIPLDLAVPQKRVHHYLAPWHVKQAIRRHRPDVVHTHGLPGMAVVGPLAFLGQAGRWIHTFHYGNYPYDNARYMFAERIFSRAATELVAVAEAQRQTLIKHHKLDPARIITLPNGVRDNAFLSERDAVRTRKRAELGIPLDAPVVGTIAVLSEQKGVQYLIEAARQIVDRIPQVCIVVAGDGVLREDLMRQAQAKGLGESIRFIGWRADVGELLLTFDLFVMSSLWEAMPLALLEAMAAGRPIVVTDVGDNRRIVLDGEAARVVPPADGPALAAAIVELLEHADTARDLGARARARFESRFTIAQMVAAYERLYEHAGDRSMHDDAMMRY